MGEDLLSSLSMESHHPSTLLSMDSSGGPPLTSSSEDSDRELLMQSQQIIFCGAPDINLPLSNECSPPQQLWNSEHCDILDVSLGPQTYNTDAIIHHRKFTATRKCTKRGDSIWGAWFFFNFYFKPLLSDKSKAKIKWDGNGVNGFEKSDLCLDMFLVQHDMENMYMWVFKERPENALGKMQLRSYVNGHCRLGEPQFPFSVDRGFVRSHRMQRKHYRGLSNPQCVHGIELIRSPNLSVISEVNHKKWMELTGRDLDFSIPPEASDFESWRNLPRTEFELERHPPPLKSTVHSQPKKLLNGSNLNLSSQKNHNFSDVMALPSVSSKRKKDFFFNGIDVESPPTNSFVEKPQDLDLQQGEPSWLHDFKGVMKQVYGPVTAAKTIYEDEQGYLLLITLPFVDRQRVKVSWRNSLSNGIVKILCVSVTQMMHIRRHDRIFKLTDHSPEHCPPGEFIREITLPTRIPEDAKLEAYYDETGALLEIMVPKHQAGPEEHEVHVYMRPPHYGFNELVLT